MSGQLHRQACHCCLPVSIPNLAIGCHERPDLQPPSPRKPRHRRALRGSRLKKQNSLCVAILVPALQEGPGPSSAHTPSREASRQTHQLSAQRPGSPRWEELGSARGRGRGAATGLRRVQLLPHRDIQATVRKQNVRQENHVLRVQSICRRGSSPVLVLGAPQLRPHLGCGAVLPGSSGKVSVDAYDSSEESRVPGAPPRMHVDKSASCERADEMTGMKTPASPCSGPAV